jgi:uncharacterized protein YcnI
MTGRPDLESMQRSAVAMLRKTAVPAVSVLGLLLAPVAAQAHVSLHPNVVPSGAFATLNLRVPNEMGDANTTKIDVQMPRGFDDVTAAPPPGWTFSLKTKKMAKPVQTDDGPIDTEVSEITFSGGKLPPEQFAQFPISVVIPGKAGDVLTFKTVQTYSNGKVARWIGPPSSDSPAPTIDVSAKGGVLQDVAGGEAGPPSVVVASASSAPAAKPAVSASVPRVVHESDSTGKTLSIIALVVGVIAIALSALTLLRRRGPVAT